MNLLRQVKNENRSHTIHETHGGAVLRDGPSLRRHAPLIDGADRAAPSNFRRTYQIHAAMNLLRLVAQHPEAYLPST